MAALPASSATPASAAAQPSSPSNEGPPGPPALLPNGRVAAPPQVSSPQIATGCPPAPYGANYYAPGTGKTVALTFDDGPGASTAAILSALRSKGVTATFFNLGQNAAARPQLVSSEARAGYLLGNHTWNHPDMSTLSAAAQATQMDRAIAEQKILVGTAPCAFRPPGGAYNSSTLSLAQQRRMKFWTWSVDTEDWKANGSSSSYWVNRIITLAEKQGGALQHPVVLMHNQPAGNPATVLALPAIINFFRGHGYTFVNLLGNTGLGYLVLTSDGGVRNFGTDWHGSARGSLPAGVRTAGLAANPATGGYWILKSNGGVGNFGAPWYGSAKGTLGPGVTVAAIAASRGGYLVLTSSGGIRNFGAPWHGSDAGTLAAGVTPVGLAADPATGGYWILKSNGGVTVSAPLVRLRQGHARPRRDRGRDRGQPRRRLLDPEVQRRGERLRRALARLGRGHAPAGVTPVGLTAAPATGGYWILKSNGGIDGFGAPWHGSLTGTLPPGATVTGIAGQ